jgi:hypothetical protein
MMVLLAVLVGINWQAGKHLTEQFVQQIVNEDPWPKNTTIYFSKRQIQASDSHRSRAAAVEKDLSVAKEATSYPQNSSDHQQIHFNTSTIRRVDDYILGNEQENNEISLFSWQNKSSVDYFGCCGAGHRLSRTANAYWVARHVLNFGLRVYWRFCGTVEVFSYLFQPQPLEELRNVTSWNRNVYFHNEIPGFVPFSRLTVGGNAKRSCKCKRDKIQSDAEFYASLRDRYRFKDQVDSFRAKHFDDAALSIGLHIRAGNNETGDFAIKGRGIERIDEWVHHVARHIVSLVDNWMHLDKPSTAEQSQRVVVYLATDTPSMLSIFRSLLLANATTISKTTSYSISVVEFPQNRLKEGSGVMFGASETEIDDGNECLQSWQFIFADLMLLSHVDILVAPRSSSFTQTLPMSLVFSKRRQQEQQRLSQGTSNSSSQSLPPAFCEMNRNASIMHCYDTLVQWCCESYIEEVGTHFLVPGKKLKWFSVPRQETCLPKPENRGRPGYCLPFRWPKEMQEQRPIVSRRRRRDNNIS